MDPYNPVVSIHLGQAGCQLGATLWDLLRKEHRIQPNGKFETSSSPTEHFGPLATVNTKIDTFFGECANGRYRPRAIFADLDAYTIETIKESPSGESYHPNQLIAGKEDAAGNFASGYYLRGHEFIGSLLERIDKMVEASGTIQGFIMTRSLGGGTGSGLSSLLLQILQEKYPKTGKITFDILPSLSVPETNVEPYNVVLASHNSIDTTDLSILFEQDAILRMCSELLEIELPTTGHCDAIIAQVISTLLSPLHLEGTVNRSLAELRMNLVPYKRMHFPVASYAPFPSLNKTPGNTNMKHLLRHILHQSYQTVDCNPINENYMALSTIFRGADANLDGLHRIERLLPRLRIVHPRFKFVDWVPKNYAAGVSSFRPAALDRSGIRTTNMTAAGLINSPAVVSAWKGFLAKARAMKAGKLFVNWYESEGLLESELNDAMGNLHGLMEEYKEVSRGVDVSRVASRRTCSVFPFAP